MKYTVTHKFSCSLVELLAARENRYKNLDKFPELKNITILEEKQEGNRIFQKRKVSLVGSLPQAIAHLLQDPSLLEESVFDTVSHTHEFKMAPPGKESVVTIKGKSVYRSTGENSSERSYEVEVKSQVFLLAPVVEAAIEEIHKHSLEKDRTSILKFLSEKS